MNKSLILVLTAFVPLAAADEVKLKDGTVYKDCTVEVETPEEYAGNIMGDLSSRRGMVQGMEEQIGSRIVRADVPLAEMFGYSTILRSMTQGRATFSMEFHHYAQTPSNVADEIIAHRQKRR